MKRLYVLVFLLALIGAGCTTTAKRGTYTIDVRQVEEKGVRISGYLSSSALARWDRSPYGREPKLLVELMVRSLLPGVATERYSIHDIKFTGFETNPNPGMWGAVVTGDEEVVRLLSAEIGKRVQGEFSFVAAQLIGVPTERPYTP